jgi:L,D-transpeptidase ErfK/SrfK
MIVTGFYTNTLNSGLTKTNMFLASIVALSFIAANANATTYQLPVNPGDTVLEQFPAGDATATVLENETLLDMALRYTLGQTEIIKLNPKMDRWLIKKGQVVRLPNRRILPDTPHNGITLNISEFRMYYYPPGQQSEVMSFAHGIGRQDWKTPLGKTSVVRKVKDPAWHPPESIRREHAANGDPLPEIVPPGPHNPLGTRALYLNLPGEYRIHGTDVDKIYGIGMQITHGCVRMYPEDVETLYDVVPLGTAVYIVKQPIKVGWLNNVLYIEAHPDLEGEEMGQERRYATALNLIQKATNEEMPEFDQKALNQALKDLDGEPVAIYDRPLTLAPQEATPSFEEAIPDLEQTKPDAPEAGKGSPGGYYRGT